MDKGIQLPCQTELILFMYSKPLHMICLEIYVIQDILIITKNIKIVSRCARFCILYHNIFILHINNSTIILEGWFPIIRHFERN